MNKKKFFLQFLYSLFGNVIYSTKKTICTFRNIIKEYHFFFLPCNIFRLPNDKSIQTQTCSSHQTLILKCRNTLELSTSI